MRWFKLTLAYDGSRFAGWQWQPDRRTVQSTLEEMLQKVTGETIRVAASSRTDAGVHALGQVVSFSSQTKLPPYTLWRALNARAPDDVSVVDVAPAREGFHATRDSVCKRYRYVIQDGVHRDVFWRHQAWRVWTRLDLSAMASAATRLVGRQDFASFQTSGSERLTTTRTVQEITVRRSETLLDHLEIEVQADGFLYNMVRNFVGTLVTIGKNRRPVDWIDQVLEARDRRRAGMTAPPQGLFLLWVQHAAVPLPQRADICLSRTEGEDLPE